MSLNEDLAAIPKTPRTFAQWRATAQPDEITLVEGYMADVDVPITLLTETLRRHGIPCNRETIVKHRGSRD